MTQPQVSVGIPAYNSPAVVEGRPHEAVAGSYGKSVVVARDYSFAASEGEKTECPRELEGFVSFPARGVRP